MGMFSCNSETSPSSAELLRLPSLTPMSPDVKAVVRDAISVEKGRRDVQSQRIVTIDHVTNAGQYGLASMANVAQHVVANNPGLQQASTHLLNIGLNGIASIIAETAR